MRVRSVAAIALAAVVGGAIAMSAAAPASASTVPLSISLGVVLPGASATATHPFSVAQDSVVADAVWTAQDGSAGTRWQVRVCDTTGCRDVADLAGARLAAGAYRLAVTVTMPEAAAPGTTVSGAGSIRLAEAGGRSLAVTGGQGPWLAALVGGAACVLGALLLRRRKGEEVSQ